MVLLVAVLPSPSVSVDVDSPSTAPLTLISFGSCNKDHLDQSIFGAIARDRPDLFIWLGDIVYADRMLLPHYWVPTNSTEVRARFASQRASPLYAALASSTRVLGIYDDHDYGMNNGGAESPLREAAREALFEFLSEPKDSPRRARGGVYGSYSFGRSPRRVRVILLDNRYFYDKSPRARPDSALLGEEQWAWLEREFASREDYDLTLIATGIQFVALGNVVTENWANFPAERQRLINLISISKTKAVVFLSGDVHFAEIQRADCTTQLQGFDGYPLYDATSSGLTHAWGEDPVLGPVFPLIKDFLLPPSQRVGATFDRRNYGAIEIDWDKRLISIQIRDVNGAKRLAVEVKLDDLAPRPLGDYETCARLAEVTSSFRQFSLFGIVGLFASVLAAITAATKIIWRLVRKLV